MYISPVILIIVVLLFIFPKDEGFNQGIVAVFKVALWVGLIGVIVFGILCVSVYCYYSQDDQRRAEHHALEQREKTPCPAILTSAAGKILEYPLPENIGRPDCVGNMPTRVATPDEQAKWSSWRYKPDAPKR